MLRPLHIGKPQSSFGSLYHLYNPVHVQQGGEGARVPHFGQEKVRKRFYETKARAAVSTEEETEHGGGSGVGASEERHYYTEARVFSEKVKTPQRKVA